LVILPGQIQAEIRMRSPSVPRDHKLDVKLLSYFHTVAKTLNITHAAKALNIAQPTLSKAIQQLERQVGALLLERNSYGISLTPIGERLSHHAAVVMAQVKDAVEDVSQLRTGEIGEVRVGAGPSWVRRKLPDAVARARLERPGLRVDVLAGFDAPLLERLAQGELDFVVAERPLPDDAHAFTYRNLTSDDLVVVAGKNHPLAQERNIPPTAVLDLCWALPAKSTLARRKLDGRMTSLGFAPPKPMITSSSLTFLMMIACQSDAVLYTTRSVLHSPEGAMLCEIDVPDLITTRDAGLIFRAPGLLPTAAMFLVETIENVCRADPYN